MPKGAPPSPPEEDAGLICLTLVARHHGKTVDPVDIRRRLAHWEGPFGMADLARAATLSGFKAGVHPLTWEGLERLPGGLPALIGLRDGGVGVLLAVIRRRDRPLAAVLIPGAGGRNPEGPGAGAPSAGGARELDREALEALWTGEVLFVKPIRRSDDPARPFGLGWFVPEFLRLGGGLRDVVLAAVALHVLALASPVYFQIVIDKVLVHQTVGTLVVLTLGVSGALCFEAVFRFLRQHVVLEIANRIDIRLLNHAFTHLLRLPIAYFDGHPAGVTVRHLQQAERVREFLTGQLLSTLLDSLALVVALPLLLVYSGRLTLVVLGFAAVTAAVAMVLAPIYRRRLNALYAAEAEKQAMLVETTHGMRTVKSLAVEPTWEREWDRRAAHAIGLHYGVGRLSLIARGLIELLERLMMVAVIAVGAFSVFAGELSVGALIAFQMLAGRVAAPLVQMAGLINQYQETLLSVRMLGTVLNHPTEPRRGGGVPALTGGITLERVGFRHHPDRPPALRDLSLRVPPGAVLGVVGRSGSGKSTLARLLQGFHPPGEGRLLFDTAAQPGVDAREIDIGHLRRSIGMVLQDNFLFRGTVRDNIAMTMPNVDMERVIMAARLAGVDDFISGLPQGYDTPIEEGGSNLSGGQRQRIAIARALLPQPRILILDEATSALDPDSEAVVMENLGRIAQGRTVILISHRLSTLTGCDTIAVLEEGALVDMAPHRTLLERCDVYRHLWRRQNRGA